MTTENRKLAVFALGTSKDNDTPVGIAVRHMRDEAQEVALAIGCTVDRVIAWCDQMSSAPASVEAIATDAGNGNCPTCQLDGVTPERARREAPAWYAALESVHRRDVPVPAPDEPAACCRECRQMIAAGMDPAAIIAPDHAAFRAMGETEPAPGWEDRAVERAQREGLLTADHDLVRVGEGTGPVRR